MDIFEELFGNVLSDDEIQEMIFLRNNGKLRTSYKGDPKLQPNSEQLRVFAEVLSNVYKIADENDGFKVIPPDITPDTAFRIYAEASDLDFSFSRKEALQKILPLVSVFGVDIKDEETLMLEFVVPDVYTYPFEEAH